MVTRKPLPENAKPLSPLPTESSQMQDSRQDPWSAAEPTSSPWDDAPRQPPYDGQKQQQSLDIPNSLRPGGSNFASSSPSNAYIPPQIARDEHVWDDATPYTSPAYVPPTAPVQTAQYTGASDSLRPGRDQSPGGTETNPFKRKGLSQSSSRSGSQHPAAPPTQAFGEMSVNDGPPNPWQPEFVNDQKSGASPAAAPGPPPPPFPSDLGGGPEGDPWQMEPPLQPQPRPASPAMQSVSSGRASPAWDDLPENQTKPPPRPQQMPQETEREINEDRHAWDDGLVQEKGKSKDLTPATTQQTGSEGPLDDWSLIDPASASRHSNEDTQSKGKSSAPELLIELDDEKAPALPPRGQTRPRYSPRPVDSKSETYQIKKISWYDHKAASNPRTSPILVQNENGPCPLVALVNALTLTTPADRGGAPETALVEVLRSREQISLGLLLDAVFDELMSPRRTTEDTPLPDVGELYDFMKGLHTGMNVNPRFVPNNTVVEAFKRTSLTHLHPVERGDMIPGTFEDTVEMELYSAFSIPLIHGWLPTKDDPAYDAFSRRATSYDQAQNLLFHEEELEAKLSSPDGEALTEDEQQLYQDIITIRSFLEGSATQLTPWGLDVITKAMRPGLFAILFRNDHFSTLYRHPQTQQLLALVTDAGYASHGDVVWESLADINGVNTEYLSGSFQPVGGQEAQKGGPQSPQWFDDGPSSSQAGASAGWTTVQGRGSSGHDRQPSDVDHVQEDHDLALAMQMQEEEDERHRSEQARRKRERELSEQFIEQQARQSGPTGVAPVRGGSQAVHGARRPSQGQASLVSPRVSSSTPVLTPTVSTGRRQSGQSVTQQVRPLVPPAVVPSRRPGVNRAPDDGTDDAPPTYEQAQHSTPYVPPVGHPSHPTASQGQGQADSQPPPQGQTQGVTGQRPTQGRGQYPGTTIQSNNARWGPTPSRPPQMGGLGRGRPVPLGQTQSSGRDRDCVLM